MHLSIPKPCHEDWTAMIPNEQGRHCNICCKTVVDFTSMTDEEVKYFFLNKNKAETVCGRFKNEQLHRIKIELPYNIYTLSMPLWKRFLTACLLAFSSMLFSCDTLVSNNNTMGEIISNTTLTDSTRLPTPPRETLGSTALIIDTTLHATCSPIMGDIETISTITQGMTVSEPVESTVMGEPPIDQPDTAQTMFSGNAMIDSNEVISPVPVDSVNADNRSQPCNNKNINL